MPQPPQTPHFLFGQEYRTAFVAAADAAKVSILAITYRLGPILVTPPNPFVEVLESLERAAKRRIDVRLHFSPHGLPRQQLTVSNNLLARLGDAGIHLRQSNYADRLHAKVVIFDNSLCIIGSHNLTHHSLKSHGEISAMFPVPHRPDRIDQWLKLLTRPAHARTS